MKKTIIAIMLTVIMLVAIGCTTSIENTNNDFKPDGQLIDGLREISISSGFSSSDIKSYRGETLHIVYDEENVSISIPDYDVFEGSNEVTVKVKEVGDFAIIIEDGASKEEGLISVKVYERENFFVNANVEEFEQQMTDEYFLLDVRTDGEFNSGHIDGATLIPVSELANRIGELEEYKDTPILVYCASGNRSISASQILIDEGFSIIYNLKGGFSAWSVYH